MSTVPSSAEEIRRSSATSQSVPTPRQSQLNTPSHRLIAAASCSGVSCSFRPSVSRMAWRSEAGWLVNMEWARRSHCPIAVPPRGSRPATACFADCLVSASATARLPSWGNTGCAWSVPATTANATPSRITSTAAAVAARASAILVCGDLMDPEQSMMMISALPWSAAAAGRPPSSDVDDVTVTMALMSSPPSGRYSFWEISTVKSGWLIGGLLLGIGPIGRRRGLVAFGVISGVSRGISWWISCGGWNQLRPQVRAGRSGNGARTTVTLSMPPDSSAKLTSADAAASGSLSASGSACPASFTASGW